MTNLYAIDYEWSREHYDTDAIDAMEEQAPYGLIHMLLEDIRRLEGMVVDTRREVDALTPKDSHPRYGPDLMDDVFNGVYHDHPALERYLEIYGEHAIVPWEG